MLSFYPLFILLLLAGAPRRTPEHVLNASSLPTPHGHRSPVPEYASPRSSPTPAPPLGEPTTVPVNPWNVVLARLQCSTILFGTVQHSACFERAEVDPPSILSDHRRMIRQKNIDYLDARLKHRMASQSSEVDVLGVLLWAAQVSVMLAVALSLVAHTVCQPPLRPKCLADIDQSPTKVLSWSTRTWLGTSALQAEVARLVCAIAHSEEAIAQAQFDIVSLQAETMLKENECTQKKITVALLDGAEQDTTVSPRNHPWT